jgi:hypothetical protein
MDNAFFLPGLEYMRAPGMLHTRVDDCSGQSRPQTQFFTESYIIYNVPYLYCIFSNVIY